MDWSDNEELQAIFREEVADRARNLVEGGNSLGDGGLNEAALNDLSRDGHTIKGNALVMGFPTLADAGKLLEFTWKELRDGRRQGDAELGELLARLASLLLPAVDIEGRDEPRELIAALSALRSYLEGAIRLPAAARNRRIRCLLLPPNRREPKLHRFETIRNQDHQRRWPSRSEVCLVAVAASTSHMVGSRWTSVASFPRSREGSSAKPPGSIRRSSMN